MGFGGRVFEGLALNAAKNGDNVGRFHILGLKPQAIKPASPLDFLGCGLTHGKRKQG